MHVKSINLVMQWLQESWLAHLMPYVCHSPSCWTLVPSLVHVVDGTEHTCKSSCIVHRHQSSGALSIGSPQVLISKDVNNRLHKMLQGLYDCALSQSDIIVQEIRRYTICKHMKGTNFFLDGRGVKNTKCIRLLTEVVAMRLNSSYYPQEEGLRHLKPHSKMLLIVYTPI
jgi:hypothetical protein